MRLTTLLRRRVIAGAVSLAGLLGGTALAQPPAAIPTADVKVDKNTGALIVPLGGVVKFAAAKGITDTLVQNEDVLGARPDPMNPKGLLLTGRQAGATRMTLTFEDRTRAMYDVIVQPDYDLLRSVIRRTVPTAAVDVVPGVGNTIILTGYVTRPEDSALIERIAGSAVGGGQGAQGGGVVNALQIGGSQHVLIDVTVAQVDRTELRERGVSFGTQGTTVGVSSILGGLGLSNIGAAGTAGGFAVTPSSTANIVVGIVPNSTLVALRALRTEGLAKFLSEPKVITQSGRPAQLLAGGQQAVLGQASGINGPGVVLEQVGTQVNVIPVVLGNGKIYLEVTPRFRSVNNGRGVTTAFGFTPGFNESSVQSSVLMESGQTYAIGGLIESSTQGSAEKVPVLGDVPFLNTLFSNVRYEDRETEMLILITPRLVDAMDCNQVPKRVPGRETRSPDDYELFLESILEAPRGQRKVWNGKCYVPAYKCGPSASSFPCEGNVCAGGVGGCATGSGCATGTVPVVGVAAARPPMRMPSTLPEPAPVVVPTGGDATPAVPVIPDVPKQ
jgi:pilus assembly protein CpaC